jgi:hypothetical protein
LNRWENGNVTVYGKDSVPGRSGQKDQKERSGGGALREITNSGRAGHHGLRGMRERAKLMGGKLTVWSELDSGTEVEVRIPASRAYETFLARRRSWLAEKFSGRDTEVKS